MRSFKNYLNLNKSNKQYLLEEKDVKIVTVYRDKKGLNFGRCPNGKIILIDRKYLDKVKEDYAYRVNIKEFDRFCVGFNPQIYYEFRVEIEFGDKPKVIWESGNKSGEMILTKNNVRKFKIEGIGDIPMPYVLYSFEFKFQDRWIEEKQRKIFIDSNFKSKSNMWKLFPDNFKKEIKIKIKPIIEKYNEKINKRKNRELELRKQAEKKVEELRKKYLNILKNLQNNFEEILFNLKAQEKIVNKLRNNLPKFPNKLLFIKIPVLKHEYVCNNDEYGCGDGYRQDTHTSEEIYEPIYYEFDNKGCYVQIYNNLYWKTQRELDKLKKRYKYEYDRQKEIYKFRVDCPENFEKYKQEIKKYQKNYNKKYNEYIKEMKKYNEIKKELDTVSEKLSDIYNKLSDEFMRYHPNNWFSRKDIYDVIVNKKKLFDIEEY